VVNYGEFLLKYKTNKMSPPTDMYDSFSFETPNKFGKEGLSLE
jgi:hypothetical protein